MVTSCVLLAALLAGASAQSTWCGKNYHKGDPVVPPGHQFPIPGTSSSPLLAFRCFPAIRPYLPGDSASIVLSSLVTNQQIQGAAPIQNSAQNGTLNVAVTINGKAAASGTMPLNSTQVELPVSLSNLSPTANPYTVGCTATYQSQTFHANSSLLYLPPNSNGSVAKLDLRTGAILAKPADGSGGSYAPIFPIGFYTQFDYYVGSNFSLLDELKSQGFNVVHPIPDFSNPGLLKQALQHMQQIGMYFMYDMRSDYKNLASVTSQVNSFKALPNLLTWYTADEPDGSSDDPGLSVAAYNTINTLDSYYHPTALVLNCKDYNFAGYVPGADILMQDAYPIGINATISQVWGTEITPDYGDGGCDGCIGNLTDISTRMDLFEQRLHVLGERIPVWAVPQGFGNDSYWKRNPTGQEFIAQSLLSISHGATGLVSWQDPTTADIKSSASHLALALPKITPVLFNPTTKFNGYARNALDVGVWSLNSTSLVVAVNLAGSSATLDLSTFASGNRTQVIMSGVSESGSTATFESSGSAVWLIQTSTSSSGNPPRSKSSAAGSPLQNLMWYRFWDYTRGRNILPMAVKNEL